MNSKQIIQKMKSKDGETTSINIVVPANIKETFQAIATNESVSMTSLLNALMSAFVEDYLKTSERS